MSERSSFTIAKARRNRISGDTRTGYESNINQIKIWLRLVGKTSHLKRCPVSKDGQTLNLRLFKYEDFLEFLEWTVRNKDVEAATLSGYCSAMKSLYKDEKIALPEGFGDDMKEVFSGI